MIAVQANLLSLLDGRKQFIIPIYQRTYSWTEKQCKQLWEDLIRTANDVNIPAHFIGSVVYIKASPYDTPTTSTPQMLVIDGQQRLTTLTLLLIALRHSLIHSDGSSEIMPEEIDDYLINKHGKGDMRYKLVLTQSDKDTLTALIDNYPLPKPVSQRVHANYTFFQNLLQTSKLNLETIYTGVQKLMLVDISLDRSHDNPQLIFESLNSTGLDLSQADLIRNFILMGQEPGVQTGLYNNYWYPMERSFAKGDPAMFDRFMRDYLTIKNGRIPNMDDVYTEFKKYVHAQVNSTIEQIVEDVHKYSVYYIALAFENAEDRLINDSIKNINYLRVDVSYPFLMEIYRDYIDGIVSRNEFLKVISLVESYVFRRAICNIPTNSLNNTFAALYKSIQFSAYIESLEAALLIKDSYRRFPNDDEFRSQLIIRDVYHFRSLNYLLGKIENIGRKEQVDIDSYTIEHIMPQNENLSPIWRLELGENWKYVHDKYLHTLGNLTLTGYNSEYSDRSFVEKRDFKDRNGNPCGFSHSPLRINMELGNLSCWNAEEILKRANVLADKAISIWAAPFLEEEVIKRYVQPSSRETTAKYTYESHAEQLFEDWLILFDLFKMHVADLAQSFNEIYHRDYVQFYDDNHYILSVTPQITGLRLLLWIDFNIMKNPLNIGLDARDRYKDQAWAKGHTYVLLKSESQIDSLMDLVKQVLEKY